MTQKMRILILALLLLGGFLLGCIDLDMDRDEWPAGQEAAQRIQATEAVKSRVRAEITMTASVKGE